MSASVLPMADQQPVAETPSMCTGDVGSPPEIARATSIRSTQTDMSSDSLQPGRTATDDSKRSHRRSMQMGALCEPPSGSRRGSRGARTRTKQLARAGVPLDDPESVLSDARRFAQENYECSFCSIEEPTFQKMLHHISVAHPWYDLSIHRNIR
ncbi:hypothetical protein IWQ57_005373 [Coemansia nantahalensis]|uniref:Uncharacterized protein n=2 Tax=Coemansia TaxID=4863 RepID=A0ACC1KPF1_9FUNG|nr:hypothetical protein IWQ57_005373 [Coemansia nantahalensis]KAJ2792748.1 hypothetical protein H4R21_006129 [Coemansia helicoidea]